MKPDGSMGTRYDYFSVHASSSSDCSSSAGAVAFNPDSTVAFVRYEKDFSLLGN
jgi:hypothetical protein